MITREALRELAAFESAEHAAVTFYFQPWTPRDQSHRAEVILIKDKVREALRQSERNGGAAPADLNRLLAVAENLNGNHSRAKAIFACAARGIWHELDLTPRISANELLVTRRLLLRPLAALRGAHSCDVE